MGETKIPYSVVKDLLDKQHVQTQTMLELQQRHNDAQLKLLGEHLEKCAALFESAMNPPITPQIQDEVPEIITNHPRMSEEEEDWIYSYQVGDITKAELDKRLKGYFDGAYDEGS